MRNVTGRVKSKRRTWRKIQQSQYSDSIRTVDDIPDEIRDLVGLRVTCTNLRDIDAVQDVLDELPSKAGEGSLLLVDMTAERDYVRSPKDSGYRGWHVPIGIDIEGTPDRLPVIGELQVRTLLQDSWGELTHEDTYSKDGALPPLVEVLSKRIADLFATLDDIAEDLRTELDRIDEAALAEADDSSPEPPPAVAPTVDGGVAADAASMLADRWQTLERPVDLASLAWALQREFGAEISDDWFGHRSFKRFLTASVPDGEVSTGQHAYLLPPGYQPPDHGSGPGSRHRSEPEINLAQPAEAGEPTRGGHTINGRADDPWLAVPKEGRDLRTIDRAFPLLATDDWLMVYRSLANAWASMGSMAGTPRALNRLTRAARDRSEGEGVAVSRRHLDYVAKAIFATGADDADPLRADAIADRFADLTIERMVGFRIVPADDEQAAARIRAWLGTG
jgi:ppGpp synthetase/RelA/SpoT-type nucleotidyltranferase